MQDLQNELEKVGLQDHEAKTYLALLELGRATVTEASRLAGIHRTTGYDVLERLVAYGLAGRSGSGKKIMYLAEPPSKLKMFLEEKKRVYERRLHALDDLLPGLGLIYKTDLKPVIKFAEGKKEMEKLYYGVLEAKSVIYSILNLKGYAEIFDEMGAYQVRERTRLKIKERVLAIKNETALKWYNKIYKNSRNRQQFTEYRWLELEREYPTAGEVNIFDDRVIGVLSSPKENVAFEIKSESFSNFLKAIFEIAWKNTKPIRKSL